MVSTETTPLIPTRPQDETLFVDWQEKFLPDWIGAIGLVLLGCLLYSVKAAWVFKPPLPPPPGIADLPFTGKDPLPLFLALLLSVFVPLAVVLLYHSFLGYVKNLNPLDTRLDVPGARLELAATRGDTALYLLADLHHMLLALAVSLGFAAVICQSLKLALGILRPDFLSRCAWNDGQCQGNVRLVDAGRGAFPSARTAYLSASFSLVSLYLAQRLFNQTSPGKLSSLILVILPLWLALLLGLRYYQEHLNHLSDVTVGWLMGAAFGWLGYSLYYRLGRRVNRSALLKDLTTITPGAVAGEGEELIV